MSRRFMRKILVTMKENLECGTRWTVVLLLRSETGRIVSSSCVVACHVSVPHGKADITNSWEIPFMSLESDSVLGGASKPHV